MSQLPSFKAVLEDSLSIGQCRDVAKEIKSVPGVLSANFNEASGKKEVTVTYVALNDVEAEVRSVKGVKDTRPLR